MAKEIPLSDSQVEMDMARIFKNSWLDLDIQTSLVNNITQNTQTALFSAQNRNNLYVLTCRSFYDGSINLPFKIVGEKPNILLSGMAEVVGPFEPIQACAFAYLEQEAPILVGSCPNDKVRAAYKRKGIFSLQALGQGVSIFSSHVISWKERNPTWTLDRVMQEVSAKSRPPFEKDIVDYHQRYVEGKKDYGYDENSTTFFKWKAAENRLHGFDQGKLLLHELLKYPWAI